MGKLVCSALKAGLLVSSSFLLACSSGGGGGSGGSAPEKTTDIHATPADQLVLKDLKDVETIDGTSLQSYDQATNGLVTAIFGGTTAADVSKYLHQRATYYAVANTLQAYPAGALPPIDAGDVFDVVHESKPRVIALNVGTQLWITGLMHGLTTSFTIRGSINNPVPITSTRTGLVVLAGGYSDKVLYTDGTVGDVRPIFRLMTLMHEARHSDCTGGLTQADVTRMQAATTSDEFRAGLHTCGHSHVICPSGTYAGLAACDDEAWGAYKVGAVFARAATASSTDSELWNLGQALAIDSNSRLLVPVTGMPDMSSAGVN